MKATFSSLLLSSGGSNSTASLTNFSKKRFPREKPSLARVRSAISLFLFFGIIHARFYTRESRLGGENGSFPLPLSPNPGEREGWGPKKSVAIFPRLLYVKKYSSEKAFLSFQF
jgi:hypothetical protein